MALGAVGVRGVSGALRATTLPGPEVGAVTVLCPDMEGSRVKATTTRMKTVCSIRVQVSKTGNITFFRILMAGRAEKMLPYNTGCSPVTVNYKKKIRKK